MNESLESLKPILADHLRSMDRQNWMGRLWAIVNQAHANGFAEGMDRATAKNVQAVDPDPPVNLPALQAAMADAEYDEAYEGARR